MNKFLIALCMTVFFAACASTSNPSALKEPSQTTEGKTSDKKSENFLSSNTCNAPVILTTSKLVCRIRKNLERSRNNLLFNSCMISDFSMYGVMFSHIGIGIIYTSLVPMLK